MDKPSEIRVVGFSQPPTSLPAAAEDADPPEDVDECPVEPKDIYFSEEGGTLVGYDYPFVWRAVDPIHEGDEAAPTLENLLPYISVEAQDCSMEAVVRRYREITAEEGSNILHLAPAEVRIVSKLVWPLRYAKTAYMLGDNLGVIAQCGMVAEMVAMLLFDMAGLKHGGGLLDEPLQKRLFGNSFELLGQERRVDVLQAYGLITKEEKGAFTEIRNVRRGYLHIFSRETPDASADARKAYRFALSLVFKVLGSDDPDQPTKLRPDLEGFMERNGCPVPLQLPIEQQRRAYPRKPK